MDFISTLLNRLQRASPAELATLHADYEAYLSRLDNQARMQAIGQVEPVLKQLMQQSIARMDSAMAAYEQSRTAALIGN